jgi:hypothetical protein
MDWTPIVSLLPASPPSQLLEGIMADQQATADYGLRYGVASIEPFKSQGKSSLSPFDLPDSKASLTPDEKLKIQEHENFQRDELWDLHRESFKVT